MQDGTSVIKQHVDRAVASAIARRFAEDPLLGPALSQIQSTLGSLVKRDGHVIQAAIVEVLTAVPSLSVMSQVVLPVTAEADRLVQQPSYGVCMGTDLPLSENVVRSIVLDLVVVDRANGIATAYEVKRGAGKVDAGKKRAALRDLLVARMLIRGHARAHGYQVDAGAAFLISYYGRTALPREISLTASDLDSHFGAPVRAAVDAAAAYYRERVAGLFLLGRQPQ